MTVNEQRTMESLQRLERKVPEMTLRDYFAGQAMVGIGKYLFLNKDSLQELAKTCYRVADAMIEVRNEKI